MRWRQFLVLFFVLLFVASPWPSAAKPRVSAPKKQVQKPQKKAKRAVLRTLLLRSTNEEKPRLLTDFQTSTEGLAPKPR